MTWTDDRVAELRTLHKEGLSSSQIAKRMGLPSRNYVIGKLYRLGLRSSVGPRKSLSKALPAKARRLDAPPHIRARAPIAPLPIPEGDPTDLARVKLLDLQPHHCRFPVGDPQRTDFGFCGARKTPGASYCRHHLERVVTVYVWPARVGVAKIVTGDTTAAANAQEFLEPA